MTYEEFKVTLESFKEPVNINDRGLSYTCLVDVDEEFLYVDSIDERSLVTADENLRYWFNSLRLWESEYLLSDLRELAEETDEFMARVSSYQKFLLTVPQHYFDKLSKEKLAKCNMQREARQRQQDWEEYQRLKKLFEGNVE